MKKLLFLISVSTTLLSYGYSYAQDTTSHCNWKATALSVHSGMVFFTEFPLSLTDMEKIAPTSSLTHSDFSGFYSNSVMNGMTINGSSEFSARVDLENQEPGNSKHVLRSSFHAGFNYGQILFNGPNYFRNYVHRYDTVTSGNLTLYMDSSHYENYSFEWNTQVASIDIGQDFHSNDAKLFSGGFGYGILAGIGMNSHFYAGHSVADFVTATSANLSAGFSNNVSESDSSQFEFIRTNPSFFARIYFPLYMQFRCSRKDNFWNHLAFTIEGKTGLDLVTVPNLGLQSRPFYSQQFGIKYYFEKNPTKLHYAITY